MLKLPDVLKHRKNLMCRKSILRRCGTSSRQMLPRVAIGFSICQPSSVRVTQDRGWSAWLTCAESNRSRYPANYTR